MKRSQENPGDQTRDGIGEVPDWRQTVGLGKNQDALNRLLESRYAHPVLLLYGPQGFGKRHLAAWAVAREFCQTQAACGSCSECRQILDNVHPDMIWLESADQATIKTSAVEELQERVTLLSPRGLRFAVIPNCDLMTTEAANRILKTLEEPPAHVRFILTTSRPRLLLPTLLGRCLKWRVLKPELSRVLPWLKQQIASQQGAVSLTDEDLANIIRKLGSSPGSLKSFVNNDDFQTNIVMPKIRSLLIAPKSTDALRYAEELVRVHKLTTLELLRAIEWELNGLYRSRLDSDGVGDRLVANRRDFTRRIRRMHSFGKVQVNTQLVAEAVGLAPFAPEKSEDILWHI